MSSLHRRLLGASFDSLPAPVRRIHEGAAVATWRGTCGVARGTSPLARLLGLAARLPRAGDGVALRVTLAADARGETWIRDFDGRAMRSRLTLRDGHLHERLGPATFRFALHATGDGIEWRLVAVSGLGVPLPLAWFRRVTAREYLDGGRYAFEVRAEMPVVGLLVHYRGTLDTA